MSVAYFGAPSRPGTMGPFHIDCEGGFSGPHGALPLGVSRIVDDECVTCEENGENLQKLSPKLQSFK